MSYYLLLIVFALLMINFLMSSDYLHSFGSIKATNFNDHHIIPLNIGTNRSGLFTTFKQIWTSFEQNSFRFDGNDAIVFLHIQKTAGTTFERFLVKKLNIVNECICNFNNKKRCDCRTKNGKTWLFSRYSTGWVNWACGLHADYTQLVISGCVDYYFQKKEGQKKRMYLTTFIREPIGRFISEYSHVQRGATWNRSRHFCNGRRPTNDELPSCHPGRRDWKGVGLDEFLSCNHNLAFNRQTRMLADLTLIGCYNRSMFNETTRDLILLQSAKKNLENLAFFGIKERMNESQFLFENTFGLRFSGNLAEWNKSKSAHVKINFDQLELIHQKNHLDLNLYTFAQNLFDQRISLIGWNSTKIEEG